MVIFRNPQWQSFCENQGWDATEGLDNFAAALREPGWRDLRKSLATPGVWLDSEVHLGDGLWRLRGVRLKRTSLSDASDLIMVVVTDQTARLERDRARAEALGFVTHELRTPLVSIQGFAEYLLRYSKERASSEAAATIFQESGRLVAVHISHNLGIPFDQLKTQAQTSGSYGKAIHVLKPEADAKAEVMKAAEQAVDDIWDSQQGS